MLDSCGEERPLHIARELTKRHEEHIGSTISDAIKHFTIHKPLGEFTLVLGGASEEISKEINNTELIKQMSNLIEEGSTPRDAVRETARESGFSKKLLYDLLHKKK